MGVGGVEPPKAQANGFTVRPDSPTSAHAQNFKMLRKVSFEPHACIYVAVLPVAKLLSLAVARTCTCISDTVCQYFTKLNYPHYLLVDQTFNNMIKTFL